MAAKEMSWTKEEPASILILLDVARRGGQGWGPQHIRKLLPVSSRLHTFMSRDSSQHSMYNFRFISFVKNFSTQFSHLQPLDSQIYFILRQTHKTRYRSLKCLYLTDKECLWDQDIFCFATKQSGF